MEARLLDAGENLSGFVVFKIRAASKQDAAGLLQDIGVQG